jgi:hypothetical protein
MSKKNAMNEPEDDDFAESIVIKQTGTHELGLWDDQTLTIEHPLYQENQDSSFDHVRLNRDTMRALRNLLNSKEGMQAMDLQ